MTERELSPIGTADLAPRDQETKDAPKDSWSTAALATAGAQPQPALTPVTTHEPKPTAGQATPLFASEQAEGFRSRWTTVQTGFVDEPRQTVEQADSLVAEVMQCLAQVFADERNRLEEQWSRGADVSTEDLRLALQRYRSFFDRLLAV